ncbi:MAG TPA: hypothetical protein VFA09_15345 [Ktedonobacteraceae bacterium]|jgi:uncharacterized membrane protein YecN with MAPEG domain|nr:hypothetical protein [Ktedonobacteraceae bacterium]
MKQQSQPSSLRERYRVLVSVLIIPLGLIIMMRAAMFGLQAWTLIVLGMAFVALGVVRLRAYAQNKQNQGISSRKRK